MHRDAHIMQVLPAMVVQSDLLGSDLEWGILGNWLLFSLVGASQGQQAA